MSRVSTTLTALVAAFVLVLSGLTAVAVPAAAAPGPTVYVSAETGDDVAAGTDPAQPVQTLEAALALVAPTGGQVVLMDDYPLEATIVEPAHTEPILVTSDDGETDYPGRLVFGDTPFIEYNLAGPTTFAELGVVHSQWAVFAANWNPITFGDGMVMESVPTPGKRQVFVVGGYHGPSETDTTLDADSHITINSGTYYKVAGFSRGKGAGTQTYTGTSHITFNGGIVQEIFGASLENHYSGSTEITMTGGRVGALHTAGDVTRYIVGSADVELTGGHINTIDINNVVEDVNLTLDGVEWGAIQAQNAWGGEGRHQQILDFAPVRTVTFAGQYYSAEQVAALREIFDVLNNTADVHVSAGGSGSECTAENPCGSLETAIGLLAADGGAITISGDVTWDVAAATLAAGAGRITFVGDGSASIAFPADAEIALARDVTFESVELVNAGALQLLVDGVDLTIGEGVVVDDGSQVGVAGVSDGASITIESGEFARVTGITGLIGDSDGTTDVTIAGGEVDEVWAGTDTAHDVAGVTVTIAGGEVNILHSSAGRVTGSLIVRFLDGAVKDAQLARADGDVRVRLDDTEIDAISLSDWSAAEGATRALVRLPGADEDVIGKIASAFTEITDDEVVYLAASGDGDGSSPTHAAGDLSAAIAALSGDGRVVLTDQYTVDGYDLGEYGSRVVLTTDDGDIDFAADGAALQIEGPMRLGGPTTFENLLLQSPTTNGAIYGMGHPLTIGSNVETEFTRRGETYLTIVGGTDGTTPTPAASVTVEGGTWASLRGGSDNTEAVTTGADVTVQIDGGTFFGPVVLAHRGEGSGSVSATFDGGTFMQGVYAVYEEDGSDYAADYSVDLTVNGGQFWSSIAPARSRTTELDGSYDVTVTGGDFGHLTDLVGTEAFGGSMTSELHVDPAVAAATPTGELTFTNPLVRAADPYIFTHDGQYYFLATSGTTMALHKVANPSDLSESVGTVIFAPEDMKNLWSPEIHHLTAEDVGEENAGWYLYLSATDPNDPAAEGQRQYVLKALDGDDLLGRWGNPVTGEVNVPQRITSENDPDFNTDEFVAGISFMRVAGETFITYVLEEGRGTSEFHQTINMTRIANPWTFTGESSIITQSEYDWEEHGYAQSTSDPNMWWPKVVEGGTAVYGDDGEVFLSYSASGYWTIYYAIGYLTYTGGDPMDRTNWVKNPEPIMSLNDEVTGTGTGPNFTDHEGTDWFVFQARPGQNTQTARHAFIEPYTADADGLSIGDGSGHPAPLATEYTMSVNPIPLSEKISGFTPADTTRPEVELISPSTAGPMSEITIEVQASDDGGLQRIVANIYGPDGLVQSTQTPFTGQTGGAHTATVTLPDGQYTIKYNAHDLAGNVSRTSTLAVVVDTTAPTVTVKDGPGFTIASGAAYEKVSYKLHDAGKIARAELNGHVVDLVDNAWSDLNFIRPGVFGAVQGENTLVVYDVAGNTQTITFTLV
ncbi:family 43 glycosylhydrolase [Pseudactinotalea terrae]|uniref:family 43 glycosylhydrolase n=1 Tax=Pseudactinotalea terrae TaxID=1743262 RepID=UPI001390E3D5|nr:family 43 glycosylhydrolase [Pseudactinotalea terrae]